MSYEITGKLLVKYDTIQVSESFKKREFVIEKSEEFNGRVITNYVKFQCLQDRTNIVDRAAIGSEIKVHFNIKGTKWDKEGKTNYFTNLDAWRIEQVASSGEDGGSQEPPQSFDTFSAPPMDNGVDDLPF